MTHEPHHHGVAKLVHRHRTVNDGAARAAVFGISDGLVSNVALIIGVAAADTGSSGVVVAGVSGLLAGAASMAAGEYVSVKAQAELVERELEIERESLRIQPERETEELASIYQERGVEPATAEQFARAVMADPEVALEVHAREELGVDPNDIGNPVSAAVSSFFAFAVGAIIPLIPWFFTTGSAASTASVVVGLVAAGIVGAVLAYFTERSKWRTALRQIGWAAAACALTYGIGAAMGTTIT